jgi:hypothetical protein
VTPAGSLIRALLLTFNEFSLLCHGNERASYAGDITVYGGPILYLCIQSLLLLGFLIYYDSGYKPAFLSRKVRLRIHSYIADFSPWRPSASRTALCNATGVVLYHPSHRTTLTLLYKYRPALKMPKRVSTLMKTCIARRFESTTVRTSCAYATLAKLTATTLLSIELLSVCREVKFSRCSVPTVQVSFPVVNDCKEMLTQE